MKAQLHRKKLHSHPRSACFHSGLYQPNNLQNDSLGISRLSEKSLVAMRELDIAIVVAFDFLISKRQISPIVLEFVS